MADYTRVPAKLPPPRPDLSFTRRPKTKTGEFFWRWRIWIEATFALTVYEPWEKVVVLAIFMILLAATTTLLVNYLPRQLIFMRKRTVYYLWGEDWEEGVMSLAHDGLSPGLNAMTL